MLILIDHFAADHPWTRWLSERFLLEFRQLNLARTTHNITPFAPAAGSIAGAVIATTISGGAQAGVIGSVQQFQIERGGTLVMPPPQPSSLPTAWPNPSSSGSPSMDA
jgi:hypothetical protein